GLAFLMKQQGVFFGIFGGIYLLASQSFNRGIRGIVFPRPSQDGCPKTRNRFAERGRGRGKEGTRRSQSSIQDPASSIPAASSRKTRYAMRSTALVCIVYTVGFAAPYALTCLILKAAGVFPEFWFWTVSYASKYAAIVPIA